MKGVRIAAAVLVALAAAIPAAAQTTVFINEVHYDNVSTDADEAIEIAGPAGTDLSGWSLVLYNGNGGAAYDTMPLVGTIADICAGFGALDFPIAGIQNGSPDGIALVDNSNAVVQFLSYEGSFTAVGGPADGLTSADIGVSEPSDTPVGDSLQLTGTGLVYEDFTWASAAPDTFGACNTGQNFATPSVSLVINEIDYDQPGTDAAEFIEIKNTGSSAVNLGTFSIDLINGNGTSLYGSIALPSVALAAGDYFVICGDAANVFNCDLDVSPDTNLIQNGAPDAVALVQGATLIDTVSYEGDTGAPYTEGSGSGLADSGSTDFLGISRFPDGIDSDQNNADLSPRCITPGAANIEASTGCSDPFPAPSGLVINEIDYDQPSTDTAEFIELKNAGADSVNLDGYILELVNGSNDSVYDTIALPAVDLAPGDYFVVCANADTVYNCDLDDSPDTNFIQNGSPDAVALWQGATLIDTVSYEGDTGAPYTEGSGAGLEDSSSIDFLGISRFPDGIDTDRNNVDFSRRCITPGAANAADDSGCSEPGPPALVINEIDYDQPSTDTAEFIEIKNTGSSPVDLGGFSLELVNGNNGGAAVYNTIALPAVDLAPGDYFVVCANAATVLNCDLDASPDTNFIQNGSPDAVALWQGATLIDTVSYEGDTGAPYTEGSGSGLEDSGATGNDFLGISRLPDGFDSDQNNLDFAFVCITPGTPNTIADFGCTAAGPVVEIFDIQGSGLSSPFEGTIVTSVDNVVTAVGPEGFFMQTPAARADGDIDTSDGIFVFTGSPPTVSVGDQVDVTGAVQEYFGFTEFSGSPAVTVDGSGNPLPSAVAFNAAVPSPDPTAPTCAIEFECYEGMLVAVADGAVTAPNQRFGSDPIAEVYITTAPGRTFREPGVEYPGLSMPPIPTWDGNPEVFELDPDRLGLPNLIIPAGSAFSATGVLGYEFNGYELWPAELEVDAAPLPVPVRPRGAHEFTVGSLNLFRLFDDIDDPPTANANGEVIRNDTVVPAAEYQRRRAKLVAYILDVLDAPDILAVQEVEKIEVLQALAADIAAADPGVVYTAHLIEGNDVGTIDVGFLTRDTIAVDAVTQFGYATIFSFDGSLLNDRPPLMLEGRFVADSADSPVKVIVVHNRSLGSIEDPVDGPRVRQKRLDQAQFVAQLVQDEQIADPNVALVVVGDFNAYEFTDGYVDVVGQISGDFVAEENLISGLDLVDPNLTKRVLTLPAGERYSYTFAGSAQVLDHALTSVGLDSRVTGFEFGRGNADAAVDLINDATTPGNLPLRSSDHDGFVLYLTADLDADGVADNLDVCPGTMIPESVPTRELGTNRWALVDDDGIFDTKPSNGHGAGLDRGFTISDTAGCSCEQIIEELHLGNGHTKFGCSTGVMENWVAEVQD